jgi:hypothetical protein
MVVLGGIRTRGSITLASFRTCPPQGTQPPEFRKRFDDKRRMFDGPIEQVGACHFMLIASHEKL